MHVDSEDDGLEDGHDKELEGIQFTDNNPEWDEDTRGRKPTLENTFNRSYLDFQDTGIIRFI